MKKNILSFLLVLCIICLFPYACTKEEAYTLPKHYYNLQSKCIAYTYNDSVYNKNTYKFLAKFDYDKKIFIDKFGKYYGEIIEDNILIYDKNSHYINEQFNIPEYIEIGKISSIPKIRGIIATQPLNIVNVVLYN